MNFRLRKILARGQVLLTVAAMLTACSTRQQDRSYQASHLLDTDCGPVSVVLDGAAYGYTYRDLDRLVEEGASQADGGKVLPGRVGNSKPLLRLVFHIGDGFRPGRSQVTITFLRGTAVLDRASTAISSPGSASPAVFIGAVAGLIHDVLEKDGRRCRKSLASADLEAAG